MFRRLRDRLAEEANKLPTQYGPFGSSPNRESSDNKEITEDLINLTAESSSIVVPQASSQQFSIAEEEEGSFSAQSTPRKKQLDSSGSEHFSTPQSDGFQSLTLEAHNILPLYQPPPATSYVPQSDIESEIEEPPPMKLDGISKEQLAAAFIKLRSRIHKYRTKYSEVVKAYRDVSGEKEKIMKTLSESQDKALRRIAELREQCQLEQKAKAHLEENLRIILEEKEEMIHVLETKVKLLKENSHSDIQDGDQTDGTVKSIESSPETLIVKPADHELGAGDNDVVSLREKVKRLEALLNKCKDTIKGNKERLLQVIQEKEKLTHQLEQKSKDIQSIQEKEAEIQATLRAELQQARERLVQLEHQQEESAMAMAETKRNMHEELELKEKQLLQAKEEAHLYKEEKEGLEKKVEQQSEDLSKSENQHKEAVTELRNRLTLTEKTLDEEKQNLMQELSRGKAAAITLMQAECEKKVSDAVEEWTLKLDELQRQHQKDMSLKEKEHAKSIREIEAELQDLIRQKEELNNMKNEDAEQKIDAIEANRKELLKTVEEMTVKNTELEEAVRELHEEMRKQQENYKEKTEKIEEEHKRELDENRNISTNLGENCKTLQKTVTDLEGALSRLREEMMKQQCNHKEEVEKIQQSHTRTLADTQHTIEELEKQLHLDNETTTKMRAEFKHSIQEKDLSICKLQTACDQLTVQLDQSNSRITDLKVKCEELNKEFLEKSKQLEVHETALSEKESEIQKLCDNHTNELIKIQDSLKNALSEKESFIQKLAHLQERVIELEKEKNDTMALLEKNNQTVNDLAVNLEVHEKCKKETVHFMEQIDTLNGEIDHLKECNKKLKTSEEEQQKIYSFLEKQYEELKKEKQQLFQEMNIIQNTLISAHHEKDELQKEVDTLKEAFSNTELKYDTESKEKERELSLKIGGLENEIVKQQQKNEGLEDEILKFRSASDSRISDMVVEISTMKSQLGIAEEEKQNLSMVLESLEKEMAEKEVAYQSKLHIVEEELVKQIEEISSDHENTVDGLKQKIELYQKQINELERKVKDLQYCEKEQNDLLERTRKDYESRLSEVNEKLALEIQKMLTQTEDLKDELKSLHGQQKSSQLEHEERVTQLTAAINIRMEENEQLKTELSSTKDGKEHFEELLKQTKDNLSALSTEKDNLKKQNEEMKKSWKQQEASIKQSHKSQLRELRDQTKNSMEKLQDQITKLKGEILKQKESEEGKVVALINKHQEEISRLQEEHESEKDLGYQRQVELEEQLKNTRNRLNDVALQLEKNEEALTAKSLEIDSGRKDLEEKYQNTVQNYTEEVKKLHSSNEELQKLLGEKESKLSDALLELGNLQSTAQINAKTIEECRSVLQQQNNIYVAYFSELEKIVENACIPVTVSECKQIASDTSPVQSDKTLQEMLNETDNLLRSNLAKFRQMFLNKCSAQTEYKEKLDRLENDFQKTSHDNIFLKTKLEEMANELKLKNDEIVKLESLSESNESLLHQQNQLKSALQKAEDIAAKKVAEISSQLTSSSDEVKFLKAKLGQFDEVFKEKKIGETSPEALNKYLELLVDKYTEFQKEISYLKKDLSSEMDHSSELLKAIQELKSNSKYTLEKHLLEIESKETLIRDLLQEQNKLQTIVEGKTEEIKCLEKDLIQLESKIQETNKDHSDKLAALSALQQKEMDEATQKLVEDHSVKLSELKKKAELKLTQIKRQLQAEKEQALLVTESTYKEQLGSLETQLKQLQCEKLGAITELQRLESEYKDLQVSLTKSNEEAEMWKEKTEKISEDFKTNTSLYEEKLALLESTIVEINSKKDETVKEIQDKLLALEHSHKELCDKNEDLMQERESLLQMQNSLNTAKTKYQEETQTWINKVREMEEEHSTSVEKYQEEIQLLNRQLDESLLVAEANQGAAYQELTVMKLKVEETQAQLSSLESAKSAQEAELMQQLQELQASNRQLKEEISTLECIKQEKEVLNTRIKQLEELLNSDKAAFKEQLEVLKLENEMLKNDCINVSNLKQEKDQLNAKLCSIEIEKGDLEKKLLEQTEQLRIETERKRVHFQENIQQTDSSFSEENRSSETELVTVCKEEEKRLKSHVIDTEGVSSVNIPNSDGLSTSLYQQQLESIHKFYKDKLDAKEEEFNSRLKHLLKNLSTEWQLMDKDYDQTIYNLIEKSKEQEEKNAHDHRLEIADLQQQIFEKDSALEEMQEHYVEQLQEKEVQFQAMIQEYEKKFQTLYSQIPAGQEKENAEDKQQEPRMKQRTEASDWEDSWEVTEEDGEDLPPSSLPPPILPHSSNIAECSEKQCYLHMQQIKDLQANLSENQTEIAHLKCLVGLTNFSSSSQSLNNLDQSFQIPEATEYEYLRNILFEYMMGKEPLTLVKVIAAVLRFSDDQTELILQKEEARQAQR